MEIMADRNGYRHIQVLCGAQANQLAVEIGGRGAFTGHLIRTLRRRRTLLALPLDLQAICDALPTDLLEAGKIQKSWTVADMLSRSVLGPPSDAGAAVLPPGEYTDDGTAIGDDEASIDRRSRRRPPRQSARA